jgi:phage tail sheath protein FI
MAIQRKTPGVYINEENAFPNSVVEVPTGIPVFIGYTETATNSGQDITAKPVRISSMMEYLSLFGGPPPTTFKISDSGVVALDTKPKFKLYQAMRLYFANGGGACWVVSVGDYATDPALLPMQAPLINRTGILEKIAEPAIVCIPEAVQLSGADYATLMNEAINHCAKMQNRMVLIDVFNGHLARNNDPTTDIISGTDGLRDQINAEQLGFAAAYYPWLHSSIYALDDVTPKSFSPSSKAQFKVTLEAAATTATANNDLSLAEELTELAAILGPPSATPSAQPAISAAEAHTIAMQLCPPYAVLFETALQLLNEMPPSPAIAGVYARTDASLGVFKAPANTGLVSVISPMVDISDEDQVDLNTPLDGKAVNAIRTFVGRGVLVWGARTMDGNSQDWRYINVRRTIIMLEQSIKLAIEPFVFAPNTATTWRTITSVINNFLSNQWSAGALNGTSPDQAFSVEVGLGSTMTPEDIMNGYMNVMVKVAVVHPAEFIVLQFQQQMLTS